MYVLFSYIIYYIMYTNISTQHLFNSLEPPAPCIYKL